MEPIVGLTKPISTTKDLCESVLQTLERCDWRPDRSTKDGGNLRNELQSLHSFLSLLDRIRLVQSPGAQFDEEHWEKVDVIVHRCHGALSTFESVLKDQEPRILEDQQQNGSQRSGTFQIPSERVLLAHVNILTKTFQITLQTINL